MKFQVREGYVVHIVNRVEVSEGVFQNQEINFYAGQVADLTTEQAEAHAHKLEPKDKQAEAFLDKKVMPTQAPVVANTVDVQAIVTAAVQAALAAQAAVAVAAPAA